MQGLLERQPAITLILWLEEKATASSDDPIKDITEYYKYIDVLSIPTDDLSLSDSITTSDDVMSCIFSVCDGWLLRLMRCVCKRWLEIIPKRLESYSYLSESLCNKDWRNIPEALSVTPASLDVAYYHEVEAAINGYMLVVTPDGINTLMFLHLLLGGTNVRRYRMFVYCWDALKHSEYSTRIASLCVEKGDVDMFKYIQEDLYKSEGGIYKYRYNAMKLNRAGILRAMLEYDLKNCVIWRPDIHEPFRDISGRCRKICNRMNEISDLRQELINRQSKGNVILQWLMDYTHWIITAGTVPNPEMVEFFEEIADMDY